MKYTVDVTVMVEAMATYYNVEAENETEAGEIVERMIRKGERPDNIEVVKNGAVGVSPFGSSIDNIIAEDEG